MTQYFIDGQPHYMHNGKSLTQSDKDEIDQKNYKLGYEHRMSGSYDKWYRYNTYDDGLMYDRGCRAAADSPKCESECVIIECCG